MRFRARPADRTGTRLFVLAGVACLALTLLAPRPAHASDRPWTWPLDPQPQVAREFDPPASDYGAGHRGVDLVGAPGAWVHAVADGVIRYVGDIAGVGVVSVDHGGTVSTYQPVSSSLAAGDRVRAGEPLGHLLPAGSHCAPRTCLHLGRRIGGHYADPLALLGSGAPRIRLMTPYGDPPSPPVSGAAIGGAGGLSVPVDGPVTSPFGMRTHPLTGVYKLHDGMDIGAPCGTPVHAAASGVVTGQYFNAGYGNRVLVRHGAKAGGVVTTAYNHLTRATVDVGRRVHRGQVVGYVGQTGYATGCHLHFMVLVDGEPVDPAGWL